MAIDWDVTSVEVSGPYRLRVSFADGLMGEVEFGPTFFRGVFEKLTDPSEFAKVRATEGFVTWPGELDLAPDAMHDQIKKYGRYQET